MRRYFQDELDRSAFSLSDFQVTFPDKGEVFASAVFTPDPQYVFRITELDRFVGPSNGVATTDETPGDCFHHQKLGHTSMRSAIGRIEDWTKNIRADMRASMPLYDEFEKLREELNAKLAEREEELNTYFTREEAEAMDAKLDDLFAHFEELRTQNEITEAQLDDLRRDLEVLKQNARSFKKAAFYKTTGNKILNVCRRIGGSTIGRTVAIEAAKEVTKLAIEGKLSLPG